MPPPKGKNLLIPANLIGKDFRHLIPGTKDIEERTDCIFLFIHYIAIRTRLCKQEDVKSNEERGFVQVSKQVRRLFLGGSYKQIIDGIIKEEIVTPSYYKSPAYDAEGEYSTKLEYYKQGKSCKQYKLCGITNDNGLVYMPISDKPHLLKRLAKVTSHHIKQDDPIGVALKHNAGLVRYRETEEATAAMQKYLDAIEHTGTSAISEILKMNCGETDAEFDTFGYRLHAHHVRLKKGLRKHLYFEGYENKPLVEIDFRSSQPYLFANLSSKLIKDLVPECSQAIPIFERHEKDRHDRRNIQAFRELCQQAQIYPFFKQKFLEEFGVEITDNQAKQVFCRGFYCDYGMSASLDRNKTKILSKALPLLDQKGKANGNFTVLSLWIIRKHFPAMYSINKSLKALNWKHLLPADREYSPHVNNCLLAQRVESAIILRRIAKELISRGIIFITIHDSFLIPKSKLWEAKRVIKDNLKVLGLKPPKLRINEL